MHRIFKMKNIVPLKMSQRNSDTKLGRLWHTISIKPKETKVLFNKTSKLTLMAKVVISRIIRVITEKCSVFFHNNDIGIPLFTH